VTLTVEYPVTVSYPAGLQQDHNLASPCCAGPLRSVMNNSETDISVATPERQCR
jgi:hypothetical protein